MKGRGQRRREPLRPRRLVGRGLGRRQRLGHRRARDQSERGRPGLLRCPGPLSAPGAGGRAALLRARRGRHADRLDAEMRRSIASTIWRFSTMRMLHEYTERMYVPAAGVEVRRPASRRTRASQLSPGVGGRVSLALVIHNHQPVGNFGWVIADVYEHAYSPMLDALERHPGIRLGLTTPGRCCSGWPPTGPRRSGRSATSSSAVRWRSWAAATTNRSW